MTTAIAIAVREIREKARLFLICAGLAIVPFAATLLPGTGSSREDVIAVVGGFLSAILGLGIAVTLGASTIARDLSERRMSFYFTKPVSATAIWIGKAAAGLLISLTCFAIIAAPSALVMQKAWTSQWRGDLVALSVLAIVLLFFLSHTLSSIIRSRSPLLALDFLFTIAAVAAVYLMLRPLIVGMAMELAKMVGGALAAGIVLVLAIAPVWQLANGRSDIRRSHAALMRFLWPSIAIVLLITGGAVAWITHVSPEDIIATHVVQAPRGNSAVITGTSPRSADYFATFVVDRTTREFTRIGTPPWWGSMFSDDGRVIVWLQPVGTFKMRGLELHTKDGGTGIVMPGLSEFVLSSDGSRVAITYGNLLTVYELGSGKILASAAGLDSMARHQVVFVTPELVRVYEYQHRLESAVALKIFELDVRARAIRKTGERTLRTARQAVSISGDFTRMFVRGANVIADARTGETIAQLDIQNVTMSEMLHDGQVALVTYDSHAPHLHIYDRDGTARHVLAIPEKRGVWIVGETESGKLILYAHGSRMYVVDVARGAIEQRLDGVKGPTPQWSANPRLTRYAADQEFVGIDKAGKVIVWKNEGRASARPLWQSR